MADTALAPTLPAAAEVDRRGVRRLARNRSVVIGAAVLAVIVAIALLAPWLGTTDPGQINPGARNKKPGAVETVREADGRLGQVPHWMGTDSLGRDVYSRVLYGARVSLIVGVSVALISMSIGLTIGIVAGYVRWLDGIVMRIMDGLMAVPAILLAIALVSLSSAGLRTVIIAIVIPEVPRVVRLVRSVVLSIREEPYVEAAVALGGPLPHLLARHILPNPLDPVRLGSSNGLRQRYQRDREVSRYRRAKRRAQASCHFSRYRRVSPGLDGRATGNGQVRRQAVAYRPSSGARPGRHAETRDRPRLSLPKNASLHSI